MAKVEKRTTLEVLDDILVEFMKANTINAMQVLHAENKKPYSAKELEWLSRVIDEEELCSGDDYPDDEGGAIDDLLHEVKN
jgi:hypothetical protein